MTTTRQRRPLGSGGGGAPEVLPEPPRVIAEEHPRIARRRAQVAKEARSSRRWWRWVPIGVAVAATLVVGALFSPFVDLDRLEVAGLQGQPAELVREAVDLDPGTALFGVRPAEVRSRVESLPWIAHADVEVIWPDRVVVHALPERPVAMLREGGAGSVLTASGEVLGRDEAGPVWEFAVDLPEVRPGEGSDAADRRVALEVIEQLRPATSSMLEEVRVLGSDSVELELAPPGSPGPVEVGLGSPEELPAKALALEAVLDGAVDQTCMSELDVSVPSRVTVLRAQGCTVPASSGNVDD